MPGRLGLGLFAGATAIAVATSVASLPAAARVDPESQTGLVTVEPQAAPVEEVFEEVPVSGRLIVGVMAHDPVPFAEGMRLDARLLSAGQPSGDAQACLQAVTRTGTYRSKGAYRLPAGAEILAVHSGTKYQTAVEPGDDVVMRMAAAPCDDPLPRTFYIVSIGEQDDAGPVRIVINAGRTDVRIGPADGNNETTSCEPIKADRRRAFDRICYLPRHWFEDGSVTLVLERFLYEDILPSTIFTVLQ